MKKFSKIALVVIMAAVLFMPVSQVFAQETEEPVKEEINMGQDITKPLTRFDLRLKYQDLPNDKTAEYMTLRMDKPFVLENKWVLGTRFDVPLIKTRNAC